MFPAGPLEAPKEPSALTGRGPEGQTVGRSERGLSHAHRGTCGRTSTGPRGTFLSVSGPREQARGFLVTF